MNITLYLAVVITIWFGTVNLVKITRGHAVSALNFVVFSVALTTVLVLKGWI